MNMLNKILHSFSVIFCCMLLSVALVSCSDDDEPETVAYNHEHDSSKDMGKHKFEHIFAKQCVERETANSVNKDVDAARFEEPCMCIAEYLLEDLTAKEAEKFMNEKKHAQSLRIRYETAAYNCLQKNQPQGSPKVVHIR